MLSYSSKGSGFGENVVVVAATNIAHRYVLTLKLMESTVWPLPSTPESSSFELKEVKWLDMQLSSNVPVSEAEKEYWTKIAEHLGGFSAVGPVYKVWASQLMTFHVDVAQMMFIILLTTAAQAIYQ